MDAPTMQDIINGFRSMPAPIEERAEALAIYLSRDPRTCAAVERIDGSMAHIVRSIMLDDFETWRLNGCMGDPYRRITQRFRIEMDPAIPLELEWEEI